MSILTNWPEWASLLLYGLLTTYLVGAGSFVLARVGRSPIWVLLLLVPMVNVLALWLFAYSKWPRCEAAKSSAVPAVPPE